MLDGAAAELADGFKTTGATHADHLSSLTEPPADADPHLRFC